MRAKSKIETYPYGIIKNYESFEIRHYEARLFSTIKLAGNGYKASSNQGFAILARYIFGNNDRNEKISMTIPVSMSLEDAMTMMFMVPKKYNQETLPKPTQSQIEFTNEPAKTMAAVTFGGWADDVKIAKYKARPITALYSEGIAHTNRFYFFGYNAPTEVLNRKNEVVVALP